MTTNGTSSNGTYAETDIIETTDEDGQVHVFEKISEIEIEGQEYALLIYKGNEYEPKEGEEAKEEGYEEEVVVMRVNVEEGEEIFEAIEDEEEFQRVVKFIEEMEDDEVTIDLGDFSPGGDGEEELN